MGHAIFEQRSGVLGVIVSGACGVVSSAQLIEMGELAKRIPVHGIKMTARQTIVFLINSEDLAEFKTAIQQMGLFIGVFGNVVRSVKGCAGSKSLCPRGLGDAYDVGVQLQEQFMNEPTPKDFKISTAGCVRACTDPYCADFGVIATGQNAFSIYIGGRGGSKVPVHGKLILKEVSTQGVSQVLDYVLHQYRELANPDERLCKTIDRCGIDQFIPPVGTFAVACTKVSDDFINFLNS